MEAAQKVGRVGRRRNPNKKEFIFHSREYWIDRKSMQRKVKQTNKQKNRKPNLILFDSSTSLGLKCIRDHQSLPLKCSQNFSFCKYYFSLILCSRTKAQNLPIMRQIYNKLNTTLLYLCCGLSELCWSLCFLFFYWLCAVFSMFWYSDVPIWPNTSLPGTQVSFPWPSRLNPMVQSLHLRW